MDKGGGGQKIPKFCGRHMWMAPYIILRILFIHDEQMFPKVKIKVDLIGCINTGLDHIFLSPSKEIAPQIQENKARPFT